MTALEALIRYGSFIPVMTQDEQRRLATGELRPSIYQICGWCQALARSQEGIKKRLSEALEKQSAPLENRK